MFDVIADFFDGMSNGQMWAGALVCAVSAALVAFGFDRYQGWRRISWSEIYNGPINKHINQQQPPGMWEIHWQGRQISEGSLVILEVRNSGVQNLETEHFDGPLRFTFHGRKVVHFKVRDTDAPLQSLLRPQLMDVEEQTDTIDLRPFTLNRREWFRLLVLLENNGTTGVAKPQISSAGKLKGGRIKRSFGRARRRWTTAIALLLVAASSLGAGVYVNSQSLAVEPVCSEGTLEVAGSTAFSPLVHQVADAYEDKCPEADVVLVANSSDEGLKLLENGVPGEQIAMVDRKPGDEVEKKGLAAHRVGTLVYTVVANRALQDKWGDDLWESGLTQDELAAVFREKSRDGVVAVVRGEGSGTRETFEKQVSGKPAGKVGACDPPEPEDGENPPLPKRCSAGTTMELLDLVNRFPNAIGYAEADALPFFPNVRIVPINNTLPTRDNVLSGDYDFWAAEVLYTGENPTGLTKNFLDFFRSRGVSKLLEGAGFLPCRELTEAKDERMRC